MHSCIMKNNYFTKHPNKKTKKILTSWKHSKEERLKHEKLNTFFDNCKHLLFVTEKFKLNQVSNIFYKSEKERIFKESPEIKQLLNIEDEE